MRRFDLSLYSALFSAGAIVGAALASLQDQYGRRPIIRLGAISATLLSFCVLTAQSWWLVLALRLLLGAAFSFMQYGFSAWFAEFLPTHQRGPLYVSLTAGYPIGRGVAICAAWAMGASEWRQLLLLPAGFLVVPSVVAFTIPESPRILQLKGEVAMAYQAPLTLIRYDPNTHTFPIHIPSLYHGRLSFSAPHRIQIG